MSCANEYWGMRGAKFYREETTQIRIALQQTSRAFCLNDNAIARRASIVKVGYFHRRSRQSLLLFCNQRRIVSETVAGASRCGK